MANMGWRYIFYIGIVVLLYTPDGYRCNDTKALGRNRTQHGASLSTKGGNEDITQPNHREDKGYSFQNMRYSILKKRMQGLKEYRIKFDWLPSNTTESKTAALDDNIINGYTGNILKSSDWFSLKRFKRLCYRPYDVQGQGNCNFHRGGGLHEQERDGTGGGEVATADTSLSNMFPANATNLLVVTSKAPFKSVTMPKDKTRLISSTKSAAFSILSPFIKMSTVIGTRIHMPVAIFTSQKQTRNLTWQTKLITATLSKFPSATGVARRSSWPLFSKIPTVPYTAEALSPKETDVSIGQMNRLQKSTNTDSGTKVPSATSILVPRYTLMVILSKLTTPSVVLSSSTVGTPRRRTSLRNFSPYQWWKYSTNKGTKTTSATKRNPLYRLLSESMKTTGSMFAIYSPNISTTTTAKATALPSLNVNIPTSSVLNNTSLLMHQGSIANMSTQWVIHDVLLKGISTAGPKIFGRQASAFTLIEGSNSITTFPTKSSGTSKPIEKITSDFSTTDDLSHKLITSSSLKLSVQMHKTSMRQVLKTKETGQNTKTSSSRSLAKFASVSTKPDSNAIGKHKYSTHMSIKVESTPLIYMAESYASPRFFESTANVAIVSTVATAVALSTVFGLIWTYTSQSTKAGLHSSSGNEVERVEGNRRAVDSPTTPERVSPSSTSTLISNADSNSCLTPVELYNVKGLDF